jgi:hypothetical protein
MKYMRFATIVNRFGGVFLFLQSTAFPGIMPRHQRCRNARFFQTIRDHKDTVQ